jgi:hypothetical protein
MNGAKGDEIVATLTRLALPETTPKELFARVSEAHPGASKKEIIRAAFRALIDNAAHDPAKSDRLHGMAMNNRAGLGQD